ncbi:MAG: tetratricopeptide repeat protein [Candidatus Firestonebacteria bacterium]|nr:tetratricopeptide repeat protein [Candidatus Firestonebacteria bacterium]
MMKRFIIIALLINIFIIVSCGKKKDEPEEELTFTLKTEKNEFKTKKPEKKKEEITKEESYLKSSSPIETRKEEVKVKKRTAVEIINSGQKSYQEGKFSQALEEFQTLIKEYPKDNFAPEAQFLIGTIYYNNKLYPRAEQNFRDLINNYPNYSKNDLAQLNLAKAVCNDYKYEEALFEFKKILENYPQSKILDEALWEIGNLYNNKMEENQEAIKTFQRIISQYNESTYRDQAYFAIANIYLEKLYNEDEALKYFENFLSMFPTSNLKNQVERKRQTILTKRQKIKKEAEEGLRIEAERKRRKLEEEEKQREEKRRIEEEKREKEEEIALLNAKEKAEKAEKKREEELKKKMVEEKRIFEEKQEQEEKNKKAITNVIQNHKKAMEEKDINLYTKNWYVIPDSEVDSAEKVFKRFQKININFNDIEMSIEENNASVILIQDMQLIDAVDNKEIKTRVKMKWGFIKDKNLWKISKTEIIR